MIKKPKLERLERVELREYWQREDSDFTPWLASDENIGLLSESIGIDLEVQQEEAPVGPFRADILCRDTATDDLVIVENQLERTDHTHLGQTLTYAAGLDAVTIVWIASRFTDEHRATLDWLNRISHEDFLFFGIEVELWRIGNSAPAPKFNIVAQPNDWSKVAKEAAGRRGGLTPHELERVEFWKEFGAFLEETASHFKPPKPTTKYYVQWGIGKTGASLQVRMNSDTIAVYLVIDSHVRPTWFDALHQERRAIQGELGFDLDWQERLGGRSQRISYERDANTRDEHGRREVFEWFVRHMAIMDRVFRARIKELNGASSEHEGGEG